MFDGTEPVLRRLGRPASEPLRRRIVAFIADYNRTQQRSPSYREIGDAVGLTSTSSVAHQLGQLERAGRIAHEDGARRGLRVVGDSSRDLELRWATGRGELT
jgi:SOS-response transcriptional repressor LexA